MPRRHFHHLRLLASRLRPQPIAKMRRELDSQERALKKRIAALEQTIAPSAPTPAETERLRRAALRQTIQGQPAVNLSARSFLDKRSLSEDAIEPRPRPFDNLRHSAEARRTFFLLLAVFLVSVLWLFSLLPRA